MRFSCFLFCARLISAIVLSVASVGCSNQGYSVIASTATTIGVGISQQPTNGAIDATLGYKRAELAFVPTNRSANPDAGDSGNGAKDTGNVIMELKYFGIFSTGTESGIYQRLAVGDVAVQEAGAALLFAKGPDGKVDTEAAQALTAVKGVQQVDTNVMADIAPLSKKYKTYKSQGDTENLNKFNSAAAGSGLGYQNFDDFLRDKQMTPEKVKTMKEKLNAAGIVVDD